MTELNLDNIKEILEAHSLKHVMVGDYLVIVRSDFDVIISGEPYIAFMLMLNLKSGVCRTRIWNKTIKAGLVANTSELEVECNNLFEKCKPCIGYTDKSVQGEEYLLLPTLMPRKISKSCLYKVESILKDESCSECLKIKEPRLREATAEECSSTHDSIKIEEEAKVHIGASLTVVDFEPNKTGGDQVESGEDTDIIRNPCNSTPNEENNLKNDESVDVDKYDLTVIEEEERVHIFEEPSSCDFNTVAPLTKVDVNEGDEQDLAEHSKAGVKTCTFSSPSDKKFTCDFCGEHFTKKIYLDSHLKHKCNNPNDFKCPECSTKCYNETNLRSHLAAHNRTRKQACPNCGILLTKQHMRLHKCRATQQDITEKEESSSDIEEIEIEDDREFPCEFCGKIFSGEELKTHLRDECVERSKNPPNKNIVSTNAKVSGLQKCTHCKRPVMGMAEHVKRMHTCWTCGKFFQKIDRLLNHSIHHMLVKGFNEEQARKKLESQFSNLSYLLNRRGAIYFACEICGKLTFSLARLREHQKRHRDPNAPAKCSKCGEEFENLLKMREHQSKEHPKEKIPCELCGAHLGREHLRNHVRLHQEPKIKCGHCDQKFHTREKLKAHYVKEHSTDERFNCKYCDIRCGSINHLKNHQKTHEDPKFKCSYCPKMLKSKLTLTAHEREHTGERPFHCDVCGKGFKALTTLTTHRTHVHKIIKPGTNPNFERRIRKRKD